MAVRRLDAEQPDSFAFSAENAAWAETQIAKYPSGRQASAVIPLLWRAQEQEGWVTRPAIEEVARLLDMPTIRVLEVATFYTMFHLSPVGTTAHIQVCGTTPCMLRGSEELISICKRRIASYPHQRSSDGRFSWEEMECLGACVNAPMIQIEKDTYEDLTPEVFEELLDSLERGDPITPGPQVDRRYCAPATGLTSLTDVNGEAGAITAGAEAPPTTNAAKSQVPVARQEEPDASTVGTADQAPDDVAAERDDLPAAEAAPQLFAEAPEHGADDLKRISGIGPKLEAMLNDMGIYTFAQIAAWGPEQVAWVDNRLKFKGRILRDDWIGQATRMADGGET